MERAGGRQGRVLEVGTVALSSSLYTVQILQNLALTLKVATNQLTDDQKACSCGRLVRGPNGRLVRCFRLFGWLFAWLSVCQDHGQSAAGDVERDISGDSVRTSFPSPSTSRP